MSLIKANKFIADAFAELGVFAPGEVVSGEDMRYGFDRLNMMMDSWNTESLFIYTIQEYRDPVSGLVPILGGGVANVTIGPGQFINVPERPVMLKDWIYLVYQGVSYPVVQVDGTQFSSITLKAQTSSWPQYAYFDENYPIGTLNFWPLGVVPVELHLRLWKQFSQFVNPETAYDMPQGYQRAVTLSLAEELAGPYRVPVNALTTRNAAKARRNIKTMNSQPPVLSFRQELTNRRSTFNIYTGE